MLTNLAIAPASRPGAGYASAILADSPAGYWPLNESSGTTAFDQSGNGHNGTYTNGPTLGQPGPVSSNTAVTFASASSTYVAPSLLLNTSDVSVEAWLNVPSYPAGPAYAFIAGCCDGIGSGTYDKNLTIGPSGDVHFYAYVNGGATAATPAAAITTGAWNHIVGTFDGTTLICYIDGTLQASTAASGSSYTGYTVANTFIAAGPSGEADMNGSMGQVAFYSYALTATQVANHYVARTGGASIPWGGGRRSPAGCGGDAGGVLVI